MHMSRRLGWLAILIAPFLVATADAAKLSAKKLTLVPGEHATVKVSKIKGTLTFENKNHGIATAALVSNRIELTAESVGTTTLSVSDSRGTQTLALTVVPAMTVSPTSLSLAVNTTATITISDPYGSIKVKNSDYSKVSYTRSGNVITVKGLKVGDAKLTISDRKVSREVKVTVTSTSTPPVSGSTNGRLLASNCFQCHGTNGSGGFDSLRGGSASELYSELKEFANGTEGNGIMAAHAVGYTDAQMRAIAEYLAAQ